MQGQWAELSPAQRAAACQRVVLVGAESSGKSTLAADLVTHYRSRGGIWAGTLSVAEYGRDYTYQLLEQQGVQLEAGEPASAEWSARDFAMIATEQQRLEDEAAASGSPVLFCDTDALATWLWERRYLGPESRAAREAVPVLPPRALYLISDIAGVPFEPDEIRDGEHYRAAMQQWFVDELTERRERWELVSGRRRPRLAASIRAVDAVLAEAGWISPEE